MVRSACGDYAWGVIAALSGGDWVQMANSDKLYSAVDLLELGLKSDCEVYVAYDRSLGHPDWLQNQFTPTQMTFTVNGPINYLIVAPVGIDLNKYANDGPTDNGK